MFVFFKADVCLDTTYILPDLCQHSSAPAVGLWIVSTVMVERSQASDVHQWLYAFQKK